MRPRLNQLTFKLCQPAQHGQHQSPVRRSGVGPGPSASGLNHGRCWAACHQGPHSGGAHDTIDPDRMNAILAATDAAVMRVKGAAGSASEGEALFALGMIQVELTAILNRDLAAHSGQLAFNGQSLQKSLAQRDLAPRFDDTIGRYRLPTASLAQALRLSPDAPDALRARFELLKAGFYESFVLDPFQLVGMSFDDLDRQIAEARALASALPTPDDAEEAAFIHACSGSTG